MSLAKTAITFRLKALREKLSILSLEPIKHKALIADTETRIDELETLIEYIARSKPKSSK